MRKINPFFKKRNNIYLFDILKILKVKKQNKNIIISDIKDLETASANEITFFHKKSYLNMLKKLKLNMW